MKKRALASSSEVWRAATRRHFRRSALGVKIASSALLSLTMEATASASPRPWAGELTVEASPGSGWTPRGLELTLMRLARGTEGLVLRPGRGGPLPPASDCGGEAAVRLDGGRLLARVTERVAALEWRTPEGCVAARSEAPWRPVEAEALLQSQLGALASELRVRSAPRTAGTPPSASAPLAPASASAPLAPASASAPLAPASASAPLAPASASAPLAPASASAPLAGGGARNGPPAAAAARERARALLSRVPGPLADAVRARLHFRHRPGATGAGGFIDAAGLAEQVLEEALRLDIGSTLREQLASGRHLGTGPGTLAALRPGDLLFTTSFGGVPRSVMIVLGRGLQATAKPIQGVVVAPMPRKVPDHLHLVGIRPDRGGRNFEGSDPIPVP